MGEEMLVPPYWHIIHRIVFSVHSFPRGSGRKGIKDFYTNGPCTFASTVQGYEEGDVEKYVYHSLS